MMKQFILFFFTLSLTIVNCASNSKKNVNKTFSKVIRQTIDTNAISKIELLIADTSIIDLPSKQLTQLIEIGEGESFVDSSGKPFYPPSQKIIFNGSSKDSLMEIFNSYLYMPTTRIFANYLHNLV